MRLTERGGWRARASVPPVGLGEALAAPSLGRPNRGIIPATAGGTPALHFGGDAKAVIAILKFRRDAGAGGAARDFHVMAPRSAARGFALAVVGSAWIVVGRDDVVVGIVPIAAPLMDVVANVVESEGVGGVAGDGFGSGLPARGVVGK